MAIQRQPPRIPPHRSDHRLRFAVGRSVRNCRTLVATWQLTLMAMIERQCATQRSIVDTHRRSSIGDKLANGSSGSVVCKASVITDCIHKTNTAAPKMTMVMALSAPSARRRCSSAISFFNSVSSNTRGSRPSNRSPSVGKKQFLTANVKFRFDDFSFENGSKSDRQLWNFLLALHVLGHLTRRLRGSIVITI